MRLKLLFLLFFVFSVTWSQTTFTPATTVAGTFKVPAGVTSLSVECWGAGGAGGGVTSTLASLWAGGGGGGGAYSKVSTLSVIPATVLNYKVGAGGTGANSLDGTNGEQTFFSTVIAFGGAGGKFGNPVLGAGGAGGAASGAGIKFSGGNGATAALLNIVTINSGGGGGGAGTTDNGGNANNGTAGTAGNAGGGVGANGVSLLSDGLNGTAPGGGGSGAAALLSVGAGRKGGTGGTGKINVIYTCPTYALTSATTADDVCTTIGSTSLVRLTGGATLPNGDYVVTYNRSNPSSGGTGLTAAMSVTGGTGTGTFTAVGLNTVGSSIITVTNLTSESCANTISTFNTVTINVYSASVGGSINTPAAICSGGTSGLLTLSGYTGLVVKWQYAVNPFSTWTDILSATTNTYTSGALTETTLFRAVVKNGTCSEISSAATMVTVNPVPTIITSGILDNVCFNESSQMAVLSYLATTNTPINYSIVWNPLAITAGLVNQGTTGFSFLSGVGNLNTIVIPGNIQPNTYSGTMTILNANCSVNHPIQLTIVPKPPAPIPGAVTEPTCVTSSGSTTLNGLPALVTWLIRQSGTASTTYSNSGTSFQVANLAPGNYTFTVEYAGSCISPVSANVVVKNLVTNTYNSSGWSNGTPTINQDLVFNSDYATAGGGLGNINGCSCWINSGINVIINNDDTFTINNAVVNDGGTLTFKDNASLVQMADASNIGNIIYERKSQPMKNFDYTYWSSPVFGQTLVGLSPNTLADKNLSYTGTGWKVEAPSNIMQKGIGYIIRTPKEGTWPNGEHVAFPYSQSVKFIGVPNNGNISAIQ